MSAAAVFGPRRLSATAQLAADVEIYRSREALAALVPEWSALFQLAGKPNPFVSPEWVTACFDTLAAKSRPFVVTLRREGVLCGVAPLRLESQLGFRVLRPAGSGWSPYSGFLVDPEQPETEWSLLEALAERRHEWDLLLITQLAEPVSRLHRLPAAPKGTRCEIEPTPWPGSAYLARDVQWETLLAEGPSWLRDMNKKSRKFEREGGSFVHYTGEEAASQRAVIEAVERLSWQGRQGHSANAATRAAVMTLLERAMRGCDGCDLWLATIEGKPIAYDVGFRVPGRFWGYRGAYDPEYRRWSPSGMLHFVAIRAAWQAGHHEYDMMSGGETYKSSCTDSVRELKQLTLVPNTLRGALAYWCLRAPKRFAESHPVGKQLVRTVARAMKSPRAFLPGGSGAARKAH